MINTAFVLGSILTAITLATQSHPTTPTHTSVSARPLAASIQSANDGTLASVRRSDKSSRGADRKLLRLASSEHLRRANVYMSNRAFEEAREHWTALIEYYPEDSRIPEALFGIARSYLQSRRNADALSTFDRLVRDYGST